MKKLCLRLSCAATMLLVGIMRCCTWQSPEGRRPLMPELKELRPLVPEPPGLADSLKSLPSCNITASEREAFERDGVVVLRGVVPDAELLAHMEPGLRQHRQLRYAMFQRTYWFNGIVRALLAHGPMHCIIKQLLDWPRIAVEEAPIWGLSQDECCPSAGPLNTGWHKDDQTREGAELDMVTFWLAVTPAPHALEFLRGSAAVTADIHYSCNRSAELGEAHGGRLLNESCLLSYARERIDPRLGHPSHWWVDLAPGDAVLFHGLTSHRGVAWPARRLAFSVRFRRKTEQAQRDHRVFPGWLFLGDGDMFRNMGEMLLAVPYYLLPFFPHRLLTLVPKRLHWPISVLQHAVLGMEH